MALWTFIRHGQSVANAEGWFAGHRDAPLTERGRSQARDTAAQLATVSFDRALASDLARARDTAEIVRGERELTLTLSPQLRERTCGTWEGRPIAELEAAGEMPIFRSWTQRPGGGESLRDVARRVCIFLATQAEVEHTLLVSHGGLMRAVIGLLDGRPREEIGAWRPTNCEVITRTVTADRWAELAASFGNDPAPTS